MQFGYDVTQLAALLEVKPATIHEYKSRGILPKPDMMVGRSPYWFNTTIKAWRATRPRAGKKVVA